MDASTKQARKMVLSAAWNAGAFVWFLTLGLETLLKSKDPYSLMLSSGFFFVSALNMGFAVHRFGKGMIGAMLNGPGNSMADGAIGDPPADDQKRDPSNPYQS